jgi:hypothetical protein
MVQGRFFRKIVELKSQFSNSPELPFSDVLRQEQLLAALEKLKITFRDRVYSPCVTLWMFLSQVLHPDQSCRAAVARLIAFRTARGEKAPSADPSSYCQARQRLPEDLVRRLVRDTGADVHQQAPREWHVKGRPVKIVDGSTVSMPDTPENTAAFDKPRNQRGASGFPVARILVLLCLATGAVLGEAIGAYRGKKAGELTLFRSIQDQLQEGDILLGDRLFCTYCDLARLKSQGVDAVMRLHAHRRADFRRGRRLGRYDHVVTWKKPTSRPEWMTPEEFAALPATMELREVRVQIAKPGCRTKSLIVATTLTDPEQWSRDDVAELYRQRWHAELDLRSIKDVMHMDVLRCETPEMVRKEIAMHLLAYNLLRSVMCAAAEEHEVRVRELSFKGTKQLFEAFYHLLTNSSADQLESVCITVLTANSQGKVPHRPDRNEPRKRKRPPKPYPKLTRPRDKERKPMRLKPVTP